ncbi:MAG: hypothetical protein ACHQ2Y_00050 [Candidatus Lutacidiplasmatales archaeon]
MIAVAGIVAAILLQQSVIAVTAVLAAVLTGLSPSFVPSLSDEIQSNNDRYRRHREYFADAILPTAGAMILVQGGYVRRLGAGRLAWKIASDEERSPSSPGLGEDYIPAYEDVFLPHISGVHSGPVWERLTTAWFGARSAVASYTAARRAFDETFFSKMDQLTRDKVGASYEADWSDTRIQFSDGKNRPRYQAAQIQDNCEYWYAGRYELPGWQWLTPVAKPPNPAQNTPWEISMGTSSIPFVWGGGAPTDLDSMAVRFGEVLDALRYDKNLKQLYLAARSAEDEAKLGLNPLEKTTLDAAHLLRHGPDIPGECAYCKAWRPRF